jgi:hypothetical protein
MTPERIQGPPPLCESTWATTVPSPVVEVVAGKLWYSNRNSSYTDQMSPLACTVQDPFWESWLPAGTPVPMSAQVKVLGHVLEGAVLTALTAALVKVAGVITPVAPAVAARPAR